MLGTYYYHEIIRKTIIAFGTLFNTIDIKHKKPDGTVHTSVRVPIAYGPVEKFLARLEQKPDLRQRVAITLPRLSFEMGSITYDPQRKVSTMQTFKAQSTVGNKIAKKLFMPVPYNIGFNLGIMTQYNEDALQIIEQILPFFQPSFNLTVDLVSSIGEKRDIPMILDNLTFDDNYASGYEEKRVITHTLNFTAKTFLFGPVPTSSEGLIKKVQVDYAARTADRKSISRDLRYTATPTATRDYNDDTVTNLDGNLDKIKTQFNVVDATSLVEQTYIEVDNEVMFIRKITGNTLLVNRAQYSSIIDTHNSGAGISAINAQDDELVEFNLGDDFGFSENRFSFNDGKTFSPTKGVDV